MYSIILISYDLLWQESLKNYETISNWIRQNFNYIKPLESFRIIKTKYNEREIRDIISKLIDSNDKLITINISWDLRATRWLNKNENDWLQNI